MRAAVMNRAGSPLVIEERARPDPALGLVVEVLACGVCHTDLDLLDNESIRTPHILGHEVVVAGPDGKPCLVYPSWGCGRCEHCGCEDEAMCRDVVIAGVHADGGYAEAMAIPDESYLYPIGELDPAWAAPLADAGATSYRAVRRAMPARRAVVIGIGGLGQFAVQWLRLADCRVTAIDIDHGKRRRAVELGAAEAHPPAARIDPAPVVLDFVATPESLQVARTVVDRRGRVVIVGGGGATISVGMDTIPYETWVTTSIMGSRSDLSAVLDHARRGNVTGDVEVVPLNDANHALERLQAGAVTGRLVLKPEAARSSRRPSLDPYE